MTTIQERAADPLCGKEWYEMVQKILLAYDGGEPAKHALAQTIEMAHKFEATVSVVSVVPYSMPSRRRSQ